MNERQFLKAWFDAFHEQSPQERLNETAKDRKARWELQDAANQKLKEALVVFETINLLRAGEGASVTIVCDNPEGSGADNVFVEVTDEWTNWQPLKFYGKSLAAALMNAVHEKSLAKEGRAA